MKRIDLKNKIDPGYLEIKNKTEESAELIIYGYIADEKWDAEDVVPSEVKALLDEIKGVKQLDVFIDSGGGSVFAGTAIYNMLKRFEARITVYVDGLAGSIASVIAFAGDKLIIPSNAYMMIHRAWMMTWGNVDELLKAAELLEKIDGVILDIYGANLKDGVDIETIKQLVDGETWMTGDEAGQYFNLEVVEPQKAVAYSGKLDYKNTPDVFKKPKPKDKAKAKEEQKQALARLNLELEI